MKIVCRVKYLKKSLQQKGGRSCAIEYNTKEKDMDMTVNILNKLS